MQLSVQPDPLLKLEVKGVDPPALSKPIIVNGKFNGLEVRIQAEAAKKSQEGLDCSKNHENYREFSCYDHLFQVCVVFEQLLAVDIFVNLFFCYFQEKLSHVVLGHHFFQIKFF